MLIRKAGSGFIKPKINGGTMASRRNLKKAKAFKRLDSRLSIHPVWPVVEVRNGQFKSYIRIKRHGIWFLQLVMIYAPKDITEYSMAVSHFHHSCYKYFHLAIINLDTPFLETANGKHPWAYFDENQEEETERLNHTT
jgi:hypothetical protein